MNIKQLLQNITPTEFDFSVEGLCLNAQQVQNGDLFIALQGKTTHGSDYIDQAIDKGCVCVLVDSKDIECSVPTIRIDHLVQHLQTLANTFYHDAKSVQVIGITGTNGKTSVACFVSQLLTMLDKKNGLIGTLGISNSEQNSSQTTPDILTLYRTLDGYKKDGINTAVLEVSSHGIEQNRIAGLNITHAVFTNLTQDHLDYHQDLTTYQKVKEQLFALPSVQSVVLNKDDAHYSDFKTASKGKKIVDYSLESFTDIKTTEQGFLTTLNNYVFEIPFLGKFNLSNVLASFNILKTLGFSDEKVIPLLHKLTQPPGRMQKNPEKLIWIDYAHTPDALENAITTLKNHYPEHTIRIIFGCGGNRDQGKRSKMGKIASKLADTLILTNDNPRNEDPRTIIDDILNGIDDSYPVDITEDRQLAIEGAVITLGEEECLLIAGKGHETTQTFKNQTVESNDNDIVLAAIIEGARLKKIKNRQG
ncbi:MAG: UDP-N-acetylmuramoyl-L-alanyl-D-glutamate--2,6-diaminopimelate ligase [Catillopecten margaritatus gill symbiont]|uniref:UDP-N-acetylmuramoyl-L-alanyl-D-glutamate--2,6-diaminopimelate ligase n=1 Tax=Catillopecten margaritatus gill symbiont TaxID=3083288 RepID=A0AAU6PG81_9GAMM